MISPIGSEFGSLSRHDGFSLLELLTVILVMSTVVGLSVPRFSRSFKHLQVQVVANDIAKLLTYANRRAIAKGEILKVHFDTESKRYWVTRTDQSDLEEGASRVLSKLTQVRLMPESLSVKPSVPSVTFYPDGRADAFELVIVDGAADGYRLVTDVWTGRAKLSETHGY